MFQTSHFKSMLSERNIQEDWVDRAIVKPDQIQDHDDGTRHFLKQIPEYGNRWLRIIVNIDAKPERAVTAFFDRRLRRAQ